ncbi:probable G-protein coupled receptor 139 [Amblyraja radiata]|uniref:probable G-protein coupled receptor 139 n=1 Tax=Amblyraja radiata TaxID=386614 RepID=UPI00140258E8|nr:probable G-protein coupled receptor 139 [Amblyraja radiata]
MTDTWKQPFLELQKVYYIALCSLGIPGNLFAIYIICCRACGLSKTTTIYLVALAVSDTLCLVWAGILNLTKLWQAPGSSWVYTHWWCTSIVLEYATILLSVWITTAFTIERYLVLFNKRLQLQVAKPRNTLWALVLTVILSLALTTMAFMMNVFARHSLAATVWVSRNFSSGQRRECGPSNRTRNPATIWLHTVISGGVPYLLILVFSTLIAYRLHKGTKIHSESDNAAFKTTRIRTRRSAHIMLVVSFAAVALGLPRFISECLPSSLDGLNYFDYSVVSSVVPDILFMLQWFNSAINFWLFCSASSAFRQECWTILTFTNCRRKPPVHVATLPINTLKSVYRLTQLKTQTPLQLPKN